MPQPEIVAAALEKMRAVPAEHDPPMADDTVLSGWNGLMIGAMVTAGLSPS